MQEPGKQEGSGVSGIAEQINALQAAHKIKATPQRDRLKHSAAEEPIIARIRRRTKAVPASDFMTETDAASETEGACMQGSTQNSVLDTPRSFADRLAAERQRKVEGPSPDCVSESSVKFSLCKGISTGHVKPFGTKAPSIGSEFAVNHIWA